MLRVFPKQAALETTELPVGPPRRRMKALMGDSPIPHRPQAEHHLQGAMVRECPIVVMVQVGAKECQVTAHLAARFEDLNCKKELAVFFFRPDFEREHRLRDSQLLPGAGGSM